MTFCAICTEPGPLLRPRQIVRGGPIFQLCARCDEFDPSPAHRSDRKYLPLDEAEHALSYRILRAVRRFDWISSVDLSELLCIPPASTDRNARNAFSVSLSRLARGGCLRRRFAHPFTEYQIAARGLARIEQTMRSAVEAKRSLAA